MFFHSAVLGVIDSASEDSLAKLQNLIKKKKKFSVVCRDVSSHPCSGGEREYRCPRGGVDPESNSMAQSYGRCGGREVARALLNTSLRSRYCSGTLEMSSLLSGFSRGSHGGGAEAASKAGRTPF